MAVCVTTVTTAFGSSAAAYAYVAPPAHMSSARILAANATITGAASSASSSNITIVHPVDSSAAIATGALADTSSNQIVSLTVTAATAAAHPFASTEWAKITLPALAAANLNPVQLQITWDENAVTSA